MNDLVVHDLTPMGMYENADIVVQSILVGLLAASLLTWTVLFAKGMELGARRLVLRRDLQHLRNAQSIDGLGRLGGAVARMLGDLRQELALSTTKPGGLLERLALRLGRVEAREGRRLQRGTGLLATIGAVAPFVGLFGTVWGIMNSFVSIAQSQTTNLAVVAPGIAEALLATAVGLGAAIPAVVIYNAMSRVIAGHRADLADASALLLVIAGRELEAAKEGM